MRWYAGSGVKAGGIKKVNKKSDIIKETLVGEITEKTDNKKHILWELQGNSIYL